jgi:DNA-binding PadR family transcriptional regulator
MAIADVPGRLKIIRTPYRTSFAQSPISRDLASITDRGEKRLTEPVANQITMAAVSRISPTMWGDTMTPILGDFEQLVLLAVLRLGDNAYGAALRQEIHARSSRDVSINAVYTTLDRLERKGLLKSWTGEPTPERGGRRRKFYALRPAGETALRHAYRAFTAMADGLERRLEAK